MPGLEKFYPDKTAKGVIADMAVRADGIYGLPVFTNEGSDLVEQKKLRAFSGNIGECEPDGTNGDLPVYRPTKLFSVGLTNTPHLPVHFFNSDNTLVEPVGRPATRLPLPASFANAAQRGAVIQAAVAEKMQMGLGYGPAFNAVEREHPQLFVGTQRIEITIPKRRKITL